LEVPSEVLDWSLRKLFLIAASLFAASALTVLRDHFFPCRAMLCSKSSATGIVMLELSKYWIFFRRLFDGDPHDRYSMKRNRGLPIPLVEIPGLEDRLKDTRNDGQVTDAYSDHAMSKIRSELYEPERMKLFTDFSEQICAFQRFYIIAVPLSTVCSFLHRIYLIPGFQLLEAVLAFVAVMKMCKALQLVDLPGFPSLRKCGMQKEMQW
jgi:hypothetical protein